MHVCPYHSVVGMHAKSEDTLWHLFFPTLWVLGIRLGCRFGWQASLLAEPSDWLWKDFFKRLYRPCPPPWTHCLQFWEDPGRIWQAFQLIVVCRAVRLGSGGDEWSGESGVNLLF